MLELYSRVIIGCNPRENTIGCENRLFLYHSQGQLSAIGWFNLMLGKSYTEDNANSPLLRSTRSLRVVLRHAITIFILHMGNDTLVLVPPRDII